MWQINEADQMVAGRSELWSKKKSKFKQLGNKSLITL